MEKDWKIEEGLFKKELMPELWGLTDSIHIEENTCDSQPTSARPPRQNITGCLAGEVNQKCY
jgi:hypothetical protein